MKIVKIVNVFSNDRQGNSRGIKYCKVVDFGGKCQAVSWFWNKFAQLQAQS